MQSVIRVLYWFTWISICCMDKSAVEELIPFYFEYCTNKKTRIQTMTGEFFCQTISNILCFMVLAAPKGLSWKWYLPENFEKKLEHEHCIWYVLMIKYLPEVSLYYSLLLCEQGMVMDNNCGRPITLSPVGGYYPYGGHNYWPSAPHRCQLYLGTRLLH